MTKNSNRWLLVAICVTGLYNSQPVHGAVVEAFPDKISDRLYVKPATVAFTDFYGGTTLPGGSPIQFANLAALQAAIIEPEPAAATSFASIPQDSFITVEFTNKVVVNNPGYDIIIKEIGTSGEQANIFLSSDGTFDDVADLFAGVTAGATGFQVITTFEIDLSGKLRTSHFDPGSNSLVVVEADNLGIFSNIRFIKIKGTLVGSDLPGFDLVSVKAFVEESNGNGTDGALPEPTSLAIWSIGALCVGWKYRRRVLKRS